MNVHGLIVADEHRPQSRLADAIWYNRAATHFTHGIVPNQLTEFANHETLDVPDACILEVAKTQWRLRTMLRQAFQFSDGTSYHRYALAMRKQKEWRLDDDLPRAWRFVPDVQAMQFEIYDCVHRNKLSEPTCDWLLRQLDSRLGNAEEILEHGAWDNKQHAAWLFGSITGAEQEGHIRVFCTPESLHFRCEKKEDCGRIAYPTDGALQNTWRKQCERSRGIYVHKTLSKDADAMPTPVSIENVDVTRGMDAFGTLDHEQEHAVNAFLGHPSTWIGKPQWQESGLEYCARLAIGDTVKEELIAWSLRYRTNFGRLFLGTHAPYKPVTETRRVLEHAGVQQRELQEYTDEGYRQLTSLLHDSMHAMQCLMSQYPHGIVREMLRLVPIQHWGTTARAVIERKRRPRT